MKLFFVKLIKERDRSHRICSRFIIAYGEEEMIQNELRESLSVCLPFVVFFSW